MLFRQLFDRETCTYTYILATKRGGDALIIDSVLELVDRDLELLGELDLSLKYALETHTHADHVTGAGPLKEKTGCQIGVSHTAKIEAADLQLKEGIVIDLGANISLKVLETPGHTAESICFLGDGMLFSGDTLLIRGCGRTDFQNGSAKELYGSIHSKVFSLPEETLIYPGHDYKGRTVSTVHEEKSLNPRLTKSEGEFIQIMDNLNLAYPKKIDVAVPGNLKLGLV